MENQGEYHIRSIPAIKRAASGDEFVVRVAWKGLEEAESTWEPVSRVFHDAPAVLRKELTQGAAAEGGAEAGARAAVWVAFVILYIVI